MRAIVCTQLGDATAPLGQGPLSLALDHPRPALPPHHVRIRVVAASLNFPDALQIKGEYQVKPKLPFVPGSEVSGVVTEVHPTCSGRFAPGDRVCAVRSGGAFAEEAVVHEASAFLLPPGVDVETAAAVPIVYGTADLSLRHRAQLKPGQTVLVLGAAGGVGLAAVQVAKSVGARVIAVAQGQAKVDFLRAQGADVAIDAAAATAERPLHKLVLQAAPKGVHVVFDPVGGRLFGEAMKAVAWGAQYCVIGFAAGGAPPKIPANILLVKNTTVHGIFWGSYMEHNPKVLRLSMEEVLLLLAEGRLKLHIWRRVPLERIDDGFRELAQRRVLGKVVVSISSAAAAAAAAGGLPVGGGGGSVTNLSKL